jgi:hypothetical protein
VEEMEKEKMEKETAALQRGGDGVEEMEKEKRRRKVCHVTDPREEG